MATLVQPKWLVVDRRVGATISDIGLFRKYFLKRDLSLRAGDPDENDICSLITWHRQLIANVIDCFVLDLGLVIWIRKMNP